MGPGLFVAKGTTKEWRGRFSVEGSNKLSSTLRGLSVVRELNKRVCKDTHVLRIGQTRRRLRDEDRGRP